jgi:hypothetical protein
MPKQRLPCGRWDISIAHNERTSSRLLEQPESLGNRAASNIQSFRCFTEMAHLHDGRKRFQLLSIKTHLVVPCLPSFFKAFVSVAWM